MKFMGSSTNSLTKVGRRVAALDVNEEPKDKIYAVDKNFGRFPKKKKKVITPCEACFL